MLVGHDKPNGSLRYVSGSWGRKGAEERERESEDYDGTRDFH